MKKRISGIAVLLFILCSFIGCNLNGEEEKESITGFYFSQESINLNRNEVKSVSLVIEPSVRVKDSQVKYSVSDGGQDIVDVSSCTSSGVVLKGLKGGSCVLIAECEGLTAYMQVNVNGGVTVEDEPCIVVPSVAYEMNKGEKKTFQVSLMGGEEKDSSFFEWSCSDEKICKIDTANNACVVQALDSGFAMIEISHPKASYTAKVMIYVDREGENITYITTSYNVVVVGSESGTQNVSVSLVNSASGNYSLFGFEVTDGKDCFDIISNNNILSITPKKIGKGIVKVTHPECDNAIEIVVIVADEVMPSYIYSDRTFVELEWGESAVVNCGIKSEENISDFQFSYDVQNPDICEVVTAGEVIYIKSKKVGATKVFVSSPLCVNRHEIYVVVNSQTEKYYYISSTSNLVRTEVGALEEEISLYLFGGTQADQNNFRWRVEDSSVIQLLSDYGTVTYDRKAVVSNEVPVEVKAYIKPVGAGSTNIIVSNPKSETDCVIKCIVYPKGTYFSKAVRIKGEGLVKVLKGEHAEHVVEISGEYDGEDVEWDVKERNVATVNGRNDRGDVYGVDKGVTVLSVDCPNLKSPYNATVITGTTPAELVNTKALYTENTFIELMSGSKGYYQIKYNGEITSECTCSVNDAEICSARISGNVLQVNALKRGITEISVSNVQSINTLVFYVTVEDEVSIMYPYYFSNEKFVGVVNGTSKDVSVELVNADMREKNKISWRIEDRDIADIDGNGESCRITAKKTGTTYIYAHSDKAEKDAKIILYTADTLAELEARTVVAVEKTNYMSYIGNDIFVSVDVNDMAENREFITWECDDISVVQIDSNYDTAYLRCVGEGSAVVTVKCRNSLPVKIFVTVKATAEELLVADLSCPSVVEMDEDENYTVELGVSGLTEQEISEIEWSVEDKSLADINGNGKVCYIKALKEGISSINVKLSSKGITKRITFVVYKKGAARLPVITLDSSYYKVTKGETLNVRLGYGSVVPGDEVISKIKWSSSSQVVEVMGNGSSCTIKALEEGIAVINVKGEGIYNEIDFTVASGNVENIENFYSFTSEKIVGIVRGNVYPLTVGLLDSCGNRVTSGLSFIDYEVKENEGEVVSVNQIDNVFNITAVNNGQCYMYLKHANVRETFKILVYVAETEEELKEYYPLSTVKDHYLLSIGNTASLKVETIDDSKLSDIKWSIDNASVCSYEISSDKKSCRITAKKSGTCTITVKHAKSPVDVVFTVSVTEYSNSGIVNIVTENIIGLVKGESYVTGVTASLDSSEMSKLTWSSSDESVVSVSGSGSSCSLVALKKGRCEVTVFYNSVCYRTMVVYVCDTREEVESYKAMNIDNRYTVMSNNTTRTFYPLYGKGIADNSQTVFEDVLKNNVVDIYNDNGILNVSSRNEGIARIRVSNPQTNSFDIYIEVNNALYSSVSVTDTGYLNVSQNLYVLDVNKPLEGVTFTVVPVGIDEVNYKYIEFRNTNDDVCTVSSSKNKCTVYPNKIGTSTVQVSSIYSSNILKVKIIVSEDGTADIPYIKVDTNTLELKTGEYGNITADIVNKKNVDVSRFSFTVTDTSVCQIDQTGNRIKVRGTGNGQTLIKVRYEDLDEINCVVSVKGIAENIVYLTTSDNYSVVGVGSTAVVSVSLINFEETNQDNFVWTYKDEVSRSILKFSGSGSSVMITGLSEGNGTLVCTHRNSDDSKKALYPIELNVKVVDASDYKPVYMKTENNVIMLTEGKNTTVKMELVNGNESDYGYFSYTVPSSSSSIIRANGTGNECLVTGLNPGIGHITVTHPSCVGLNSLDLIVVVEENPDDNSLYITTDNTIIEGKLSDSYKNVSVNLVGGTNEQQLLFTWDILSFESAVKNSDGTSSPVISLVNSNGSQNIVRYLNEGTATVRVRNSATSFYLDIKFIISEYNSLSFDVSNVTVKEYEETTVSVISPTGKTVYYNSSDDSIVSCYGTNKICCISGLKSGTAVITARTSDNTYKDELIVKVEKNNDVVDCYIVSNANILSLDSTNRSGQSVKCTLTGTYNGVGVTDADQENLSWSIKSGGNSVIKFGNSSGNTGLGREMIIIPQGPGTDEVIISHSKSKTQKTVYVTVSQSSVSLTLSDSYVVCEVDDIGSVSATLSGVPASEESNIVWTCSDSSKVVLYGNDGISNTVYGTTLRFKALELCAEGTVITCTYGNCIKTFTVFVQAIPSLHLMCSSDTIRVNETKYYNIVCTPEDALANLDMNYSNTQYTVFKGEDGRIMTGIFKDEDAVARNGDVIPDGIRCPYLKVTGGKRDGTVLFSLESGSLTAQLNIIITSKVDFTMLKYKECFSNGSWGEAINYPTVINGQADSKFVRVWYDLVPQTLMCRQFTGEVVRCGGDDFSGAFISGSQVSVKSGVDANGDKYFDIYPDGCNYGAIQLRDASGTRFNEVKVCFTKDNIGADIEKKLRCTVTNDNKSSYDIINGVIRLVGSSQKPGSFNIKISYDYPLTYCYKNNANKLIKIESGSTVILQSEVTAVSSNATYQNRIKSVQFVTQQKLEVFYPVGYGLTETFSKNLVVYEDIWDK